MIALIGAGRLARAILRTIPNAVQLVLTRPGSPSPDTELIGLTGHATSDWTELTSVTPAVVWIVTSDSEIFFAAREAVRNRPNWEGITAIHSSGALGATELAPLAEAGARTFALHPNGSFGPGDRLPAGLVWSISSAAAADRELALQLLAPVEPRLVVIDEAHRALYHAAASAASNYSVTLFAAAVDLYRRAGMPQELAASVVERFMTTSAERAARIGPEAALTGPIARGDAEVVARQHAAVAADAPHLAEMFRVLAALTEKLVAGMLSAEL